MENHSRQSPSLSQNSLHRDNFAGRLWGKHNPIHHIEGGAGSLDEAMEDRSNTKSGNQWKEMGHAEKEAAVHEEIKRMNGLPRNSSYVTHRLRVLNKILHLFSVQRTASQEEELELLFAGLSL